MNVRGERIIVFGDSLTQHTGSVPVWDVNQGPGRTSSVPGDLFASYLLDQGAAAVRVNAKGGRSGYNFWTVEPGSQLIADDLIWRPTKIVFVMGTNDVGMTQGPDQAAYQRIYNGYKPSGAEMWVIGPFLNRQDAAQREVVYQTLRNVFGKGRVIDGRKLTGKITPGSDGIHYNIAGARALALSMTDAIMSAGPLKSWLGLGIGAAIVVGGALIYSYAKSHARGLYGLEIVDGKRWGGSVPELVRGGFRQVPCKSGLDKNGHTHCWSRKGLGGSRTPLETRQAFDELIQSDDPAAMEIAEDLLLEEGWKLREVTGGLQARNFTIALKPTSLPGDQWKMVQVNVAREGSHVWTKYTAANGKARATLQETVMYGNLDDTRKQAVANGWAIAKAIKVLPLDTDEATIRQVVERAVTSSSKNMQRAELFGSKRRLRQHLGGLGLSRDQKDKLVGVIADFGMTARRKRWHDPQSPDVAGACDIATQMFIQKANAAGVPLKLYAFDWTKPADLRRMGKIYEISPKKMRELKAEVAAAPDPDCMFHHVAVTDDGYAIDWTANQFKPLPTPFVFKLDDGA